MATPSPIESDIQGNGAYAVEVVGESKYQDAIEAICGGRTEDGVDFTVEAVLIHENENPYDDQAIRVEIDGRIVGYMCRKNAREYRRHLAETGYPGVTAACKARIRGGWDRGPDDRGYFGVRLDLPVENE